MLFGKWLSEEQIKEAKAKKKELKKQVFELSQNSIVHKLREDIERLTARATHFENEWFELKKTNEVLTGQIQALAGADKELKAKEAEIEAMKWEFANEADDYGMEIKNLTEQVEKLTDEITNLLADVQVQPVQDGPDLTDLVNQEP
jgi:chromosome segregation ATPase